METWWTVLLVVVLLGGGLGLLSLALPRPWYLVSSFFTRGRRIITKG